MGEDKPDFLPDMPAHEIRSGTLWRIFDTATIYKALGIDWTREYMTPVGRPVKIANSFEDSTGGPLSELV